MKAQQIISFKMTLKDGSNSVYTAVSKEDLVLKIAALKKFHGSIRISEITLSKVLVMNTNGRTTIIAKAG